VSTRHDLLHEPFRRSVHHNHALFVSFDHGTPSSPQCAVLQK
jgi:hypothetical protein